MERSNANRVRKLRRFSGFLHPSAVARFSLGGDRCSPFLSRPTDWPVFDDGTIPISFAPTAAVHAPDCGRQTCSGGREDAADDISRRGRSVGRVCDLLYTQPSRGQILGRPKTLCRHNHPADSGLRLLYDDDSRLPGAFCSVIGAQSVRCNHAHCRRIEHWPLFLFYRQLGHPGHSYRRIDCRAWYQLLVCHLARTQTSGELEQITFRKADSTRSLMTRLCYL